MSNVRKISLGIVMLLVVFAFSTAFAEITREVVMSASATYQGNTISDKAHYTAVPGAKINITVNPTYMDSSLKIMYNWRVLKNGASEWTADDVHTVATGSKTGSITVPNMGEGDCAYVQIQATIDNDAEHYVGRSNNVVFYLDMPTTETKIDIDVYEGSNKLTAGSTYEKAVGTKLKISVDTNKTFDRIVYQWDSETAKQSTSNNVTITVPNYAAGTTHTLLVQGGETGGMKSQSKRYYITIPSGSTPVESASVTIAKDGDYAKATPSIQNGTFKKFTYKWDNDAEKESTQNPLRVALPTTVGTHTLTVRVYTNNNVTGEAKYTYVVPAKTPTDDELIVEEWMKENDDLEGVAVSLRNDSDEYEKSNKNFYALGEEVIYYVDYKNAGKDINGEVKLVLELPLQFSVVDAFGGEVDSEKKTITWTMDGLEKGQAGTKVVKIKYTALSKSSKKSEIVYPVAKIYVSSSKSPKDTSAVINFIFKDEDTEISDEHYPYMIGDLEAPTFRPDDGISRAEGALVLARIFGINYSGQQVTGLEFSDLNETYLEAQKAIVASSKMGLIAGYPDGTYRPNAKMTKAEFMKIIASYVEVKADEDGVKGLEIKEADGAIKLYRNPTTVYMTGKTSTTSHWALPYVTLLCRINMTPVSDSHKNLGLDEEITRAEVAQLVNFYLLRAPADSGKVQFTDVPKNHKLYADILEATRPAHSYTLTHEGTEVAVDD